MDLILLWISYIFVNLITFICGSLSIYLNIQTLRMQLNRIDVAISFLNAAERGIVFRIHTLTERDNEKTPLGLIFHISPNYPHTPPDISISSSHLSRKECHDLRQQLLDTARSLPPEPMIHGLMLWLQENFSDLIKTSNCHSAEVRAETTEGTWTALLHLDHMRSKAKYIKLIEKWASELCLTGRLFTGKPILILLQGTKENIKVWLQNHRNIYCHFPRHLIQ